MTSNALRRIIVIGAGIAGLGAARALAARDFEVVVLEGRNRIGGRCHTENGIDLGAHWIHGTEGNPVATLARQLSVETLFVGGDSTYTGGWEDMALYTPGHKAVKGQEKVSSILLADEIWDDLDDIRRRRMAGLRPDISIQDALSSLLTRRSLSKSEKAALDWHMNLMARDDCAADLDKLSLYSWDEGYELYGYGDSVFTEGYSALMNALAEGLDIRLEHSVEEVRLLETGDDAVEIVTDQGTFSADAAVVTLPLGVLQAGNVRFSPPLPERKQEAIARLGMGNLAKVVAHFDAPFWPEDQYVFGHVPPIVVFYPTVIINLWKTHRQPALVMLVGGDKGREIESWSEEETRDWTMTVLKNVFGDHVPQPLEIIRTGWHNDPFARGSYSYIAVGATTDDIEALAEPVNHRLFFAGEATYAHHWAAVPGAYVSGLREAARISGDNTIMPSRHFTENRRWRDMMLRMTRFFNSVTATTDQTTLKSREEILSRSEVFSVVPSSELKILAAMFTSVNFTDGQAICQTGDRATQVYAISAGQIEVQLADGSVADMLKPGDVVGEYGMFGDQRRTATLVSRGSSRVLTLDYPRFKRFLLAFPESTLALLGITTNKMVRQINANRTGKFAGELDPFGLIDEDTLY